MNPAKNIVILSAILIFASIITAQDNRYYDFQIARLHYDGGGDWYSDPSSLPNLLNALKERIGLRVPPKDIVVKPDSPDLLRYPFLYITGHGNIHFSPFEVKALRTYLRNGGFIWADDNYGMDKSFRRELKKIVPDCELIELPFSHPVYHSFYKFKNGLPKIHEHDGGPPHGYGIFVNGRLALFYSFNTDIGDGLESPDVHNDPPQKRQEALRMAINIVMYVLNN